MENRDPNIQKERMIMRDHRSKSHKKANLTFNNDLFDPDSGQPYFNPKVGRGPKNQDRPRN
jgi:hypothetical protein